LARTFTALCTWQRLRTRLADLGGEDALEPGQPVHQAEFDTRRVQAPAHQIAPGEGFLSWSADSLSPAWNPSTLRRPSEIDPDFATSTGSPTDVLAPHVES
jgi:hypothetical protein